MSQAPVARAPRTSSATSAPRIPTGYFHRSELPLTSLFFILPFLVLYEVGTRYFVGGVLALAWMQDFFALFGVYGRHLPAIAVVMILLFWHIARTDRWMVRAGDLLRMLFESVLLSIPLLLLCMLVATYLPLAGLAEGLPGMITRSVGAGIYEELVFRLCAFSILSLILVDWLRLPKAWANVLVIVIASLAFSLYHYLGAEPFKLRTFTFRAAAGVYFGVVFAFRGYGITAGCHASYDVIVHLLRGLG